MSDEYYTFTAILIGFQYDKKDSIQSVLLDIYRIYEKISASNSLIYILTDVTEFSDQVIDSIVRDEISGRIIDFLPKEGSKKKNPKWISVRTLADMERAWRTISVDDSRIFVYYTGHGEVSGENQSNTIRLPSGERYSMIQIRDYIISQSDDETEICFVLDCCHSGGLGLPFKLDIETETFTLDNTDYLVPQTILVISSSNEDQKSVAKRSGSCFTTHFSTILSKTQNLSEILRYVSKHVKSEDVKSDVTVRCTYTIQPILWSWILNKKNEVYINEALTCLVIAPL